MLGGVAAGGSDGDTGAAIGVVGTLAAAGVLEGWGCGDGRGRREDEERDGMSTYGGRYAGW